MTRAHETHPPVTVSVFTENHVGLLQRVASAFTRRHINIESLTVSPSEQRGVHRFTVTVCTSPERAERIALKLEKHIDVLAATVHTEADVLYRDLALYKLSGRVRHDEAFQTLVWNEGARVLEENDTCVILEKTGTEAETTAFMHALARWGVLEFVRSGRVALTRPMKPLTHVLGAARQGAVASRPEEPAAASQWAGPAVLRDARSASSSGRAGF